MPNKEGRYSKMEVVNSELPVYIPRSRRWTSKPYPFAILMSKYRAKYFNVSVNPHAKPAAFLYAASAGKGTNDQQHRYVPLFNMTKEMTGKDARLFPHEVMQPD